jgi:hypothetical protein
MVPRRCGCGCGTTAMTTAPLTLHGWNEVTRWHERRKRSWSTLRGAFRRANG